MIKSILLFLSLILATNGFSATSNIAGLGNAGMSGTSWSPITLTMPCSASTTQTVFARRVGDSLHVRGAFECGTVSTGNAKVDLTGYTINLGKLTTQGYSKVGDWHVKQSANTQINASLQSGHLFVDGSDTDSVWLATNVSSRNYTYITNATTILGSTERMEIDFIIPISGWSAGGGASSSKMISLSFGNASEPSDCTASPCTIHRQFSSTGSNGFSSVTRLSQGDYTLNFTASFWTSAPYCTIVPYASGVPRVIASTTQITTSGFTFNVRDPSSDVDSGGMAICVGE